MSNYFARAIYPAARQDIGGAFWKDNPLTLKSIVVSGAVLGGLCVSLLAAGAPAQAKGCLKGALVGGVAGHYAGHHAVVGAIGGCITGHELARGQAKKKLQQDAAPPAQPAPNQPAQ